MVVCILGHFRNNKIFHVVVVVVRSAGAGCIVEIASPFLEGTNEILPLRNHVLPYCLERILMTMMRTPSLNINTIRISIILMIILLR